MRDPVLDREMFRNPNDMESGGIPSIPKSASSYEERKRRAEELIAMAKERQNPEKFKTLAEQSRPGVFRPVATGQPQSPQPNTAQQMAQMQAMGFRPVGMRDGGYVRGYQEGGPVRPSYTLPEVISNWWTGDWGETPPTENGLDLTGKGEPAPLVPSGEMQSVTLPGPRGPAGTVERPVMRPRTREDIPSSLPYSSRGRSDAERGIVTIPPQEKEPEKKTEKPDADLPPTKLEDIKASRQENIALAMIQAGLAMAGGESPNALKNIAAGGISGLGAYTQLEKERRAADTEERRFAEDKLARIQRAAEMRQEKELTRDTRVLDITQDRLSDIDTKIQKYQDALKEGVVDPASVADIKNILQGLYTRKANLERTMNRSLGKLGYEGEDIFSAGSSAPVTPAIDYSTLK